ncbi:hypothetical protein A6U92_02730 [Agrobacterium rubi]|nr:hypothetical protein A6U92_02730 [Agrobacterium rubi]
MHVASEAYFIGQQFNGISDMNENVIKFRKPEPPKQPRKPNPQMRKLAIVVGIIAFFAAAWAYFQYVA